MKKSKIESDSLAEKKAEDLIVIAEDKEKSLGHLAEEKAEELLELADKKAKGLISLAEHKARGLILLADERTKKLIADSIRGYRLMATTNMGFIIIILIVYFYQLIKDISGW